MFKWCYRANDREDLNVLHQSYKAESWPRPKSNGSEYSTGNRTGITFVSFVYKGMLFADL
jgi:hypothetical protein